MSFDKLYRALSSLETAVRKLIAGSPTLADYNNVKKRYNTLSAQVKPNTFKNWVLYKKLTVIKDLIEKLQSLTCCAFTTLSMQNNLDTNTTSYPVGVFNINGTFLGFASDQSLFVSLWNSDVSNQAQGTLSAASTSTEFRIDTTATITKVVGLRYYKYTGPANLQLFVGPNDIVRYGSTQKKGSVDGVSITATTRREWNRNLFSGVYKSTIPADDVYTLNCTGYVASDPLYVFHNEDSEYAAVSFSNGFYTLEGQYPKGLKAVFYAARLITDYNAISNWDELESFFSWYSLSSGGDPWGMTPGNFPTQLISSGNSLNVTQLGLGETTGEPGPGINDISQWYPYVTATNFPILQDLVFHVNSGDGLTNAEAWFLTMPKVTNYLRYITQTVTQVSAATADAIWNNVATALSGVTPVGPAKELRIQRTNNITAASLASRNALISAGWTVTTN